MENGGRYQKKKLFISQCLYIIIVNILVYFINTSFVFNNVNIQKAALCSPFSMIH